MGNTAGEVIGALGLPDSYRKWVDELAGVEAVGCELPEAGSAAAQRLFDTVMLDERDAQELTDLWPDRRWSDAHRWVLDRLRGVISRDLGRGSGFRWPGLADIDDDRLRCAPVFAFLSAIPELRAWHEVRGVPGEVTDATLRDIGRHIEKNRAMFGRIGLEVAFFIALQFRGYLYELGRLQYEPLTLATRESVVWYTEEEAAVQPGRGSGAGAATPAYSNGDRDVFRFVFDMPRVDPDAIDPATSLERAAVDLIRSGGHWRVPTGWLRMPE